MLARSYLFVPGDRPERFAKAVAAGADVVIIDLEDAVAPAQKGVARDHIAQWLHAGGRAWVRVNAADTPWYADDLALLALPGLLGVCLPKAGEADTVAALAERLPEGVHILPIIESARGVWNAGDIAAAPRVQRLAFGSVDFQQDCGILGDGLELLYARSRLVLASAMAGLAAPVDGVTLALEDADALQADVHAARQLGFGGKLCVHPRQVPGINQGFAPTAQERQWAQRVVAAAEAQPTLGAVSVDGKLIDAPVVLRARRLLGA